jgi:hypothetical protein
VAEQVAFVGSGSAAFSVSSTGTLAYQPSDTGSQLLWFDRAGRQLGVLGDPAEYGDVELSPGRPARGRQRARPAQNTRDSLGLRSRARRPHAADDSIRATTWRRCGRPTAPTVLFSSNRNGHFDLYRKAIDGVAADAPVFADNSEKYPTSWDHDGRAAGLLVVRRRPRGPVAAAAHRRATPGLAARRLANAGRVCPGRPVAGVPSAGSGVPEVYVVPFPVPSRRWQVSSAGGTSPRWRWRFEGDVLRLARQPPDGGGAEEHDGVLDAGTPRALFEARPVGPRSFYAVSPGRPALPGKFAPGGRALVDHARPELECRR